MSDTAATDRNAVYDRPPEELPDGVYCSPWCGVGCKRAAYDRAVREGNLLAKRLGAGWSVRVWENMGWFCEVFKGVAHVHRNVLGCSITGTYTVASYTVFFNSARQVLADGDTPEAALSDALTAARNLAARLTADVDAVEA